MGKFKSLGIALLLLAGAFFCSCEKDIEFIGQFDGEKMVMFSCASAGKPMEVILSKSTFILSTDETDPALAVKDARLTGRAGGRTIEFTTDPEFPGRYFSTYEPAEGETVELSASCPGFTSVSGVATVPAKPSFSIDNAEIVAVDDAYHRAKLRVTIHDAAGIHNCYRLKLAREIVFDYDGRQDIVTDFLYPVSRDPIFVDSQDEVGMFAGAVEGDDPYVPDYFDDGFIDGQDYSFEMSFEYYDYDDIYYYVWDEERQDDSSDAVMSSRFFLELSNVSDDLYRYALSLEAYNGFASEIMSLFGEAVCVHSNIDGGIGCFGAMNSAIGYFVLPE